MSSMSRAKRALASGPGLPLASPWAMAEITPGARVWVRTGGGTAGGVVRRLHSVIAENAAEFSVVIVLDNGTGVVVASTASRGKLWDLEDGANAL